MPPGRPSWLARRIGRALSRHLLRRSLAVQGIAGEMTLATVVSTRRRAGHEPARSGHREP
jgi:hypothetical protein